MKRPRPPAGRRGRPPYPDVLTPREWEVLEFLRQGLSNEQIAERLGITLRTAKFHVSEILSKLAVETREQAAAWQPEAPPARARRWLAWPLAARITGALVVAAAVAGLGLLTWGVLRTSGSGSGPLLSESVAAGLVRQKLGHENPGFFIGCEPITFDASEGLWRIRCSLTNAQGKKWSDWSIDDRSGAIARLPGGEPGFPTKSPGSR